MIRASITIRQFLSMRNRRGKIRPVVGFEMGESLGRSCCPCHHFKLRSSPRSPLVQPRESKEGGMQQHQLRLDACDPPCDGKHPRCRLHLRKDQGMLHGRGSWGHGSLLPISRVPGQELFLPSNPKVLLSLVSRHFCH